MRCRAVSVVWYAYRAVRSHLSGTPDLATVAPAGLQNTCKRFRLYNCNDLKDQRKPSIHLYEEPAIVVREVSAALPLTPQDHQLMSERGILSIKPDLRLEW